MRKKSAKLIEMEDFESPEMMMETEADGKSKKKHSLGGGAGSSSSSSLKKHGEGGPSPVVIHGLPASGYLTDHPGLSAKLTEIKSVKKTKIKPESVNKILSPLKINISDHSRLRPSDDSPAGPDAGLRLKLILSPKKEVLSSGETELSAPELSPVKPIILPTEEPKKKKKKSSKHRSSSSSGLNALDCLAAGGLVSSSLEIKQKSKPKKKSKEHHKPIAISLPVLLPVGSDSPDIDVEDNALQQSSELVIAEPVPKSSSKKKKSSSKKLLGEVKQKVKALPIEQAEHQVGSFYSAMCTADDEDVDSNQSNVPGTLVTHSRSVYLTEKKKGKKKKGSKVPPDKKEKKKARPMTAYMLWCREHRQRIVAENRDMDFATISRRLGEAWQSLSDKEKLNWRRKAKRLSAKTSNLINTGKGEQPRSKLLNKQHKLSTSDCESSHPRDLYKVVGTAPIDVAAHLKLLGESLSIIGQRLTEHEGQIAVSGSLSVLLDSTLCALGPLLCLSAEVDEVNGCSSETLGSILDNIAYIMPGL